MNVRVHIRDRGATTIGRGLALAALAAAVSLTLVSAARAEPAPLLSLGPISVNDGVATFSGTVGPGGAAASELTVNGEPIGVDASGAFQATLNLGGTSKLVISGRNPANGESFTITIPLSVAGPDGIIGAPLDLLRHAGISVTLPPDGFSVLDGQPFSVVGRVLDSTNLSSLTVNGRELLGALGPSGQFSQPVSPAGSEVTVSATDTRGVSQTSTFPVAQVSSVIATPAGKSISAVGARGLRIASVRYVTKGIAKTRRLQMIVTVRDFRGLLVRGAIVTIKKAPRARNTIGGRQVKLTNSRGQAKFALRLRPGAFAKRLSIATLARTPNARAEKVTSVRLPKLAVKRKSGAGAT